MGKTLQAIFIIILITIITAIFIEKVGFLKKVIYGGGYFEPEKSFIPGQSPGQYVADLYDKRGS